MLRCPTARMVQLTLAMVLLAGCGATPGASPDDSNETSTSIEENEDQNGERNAGKNGGQDKDQNSGQNGGRNEGKNEGRNGGGGNGTQGEKKKYYEVGGPTLDGSYPATFGDFSPSTSFQCLAVSNREHPRPVRITGVAISQRPSSPKAFFLGSPSDGSPCRDASTSNGGKSLGPCAGAELPSSTEKGTYCELWVGLRQVASLDYYGAVTMNVESDCVAIEGGGPFCERLDASVNPSAEHPAAFRKPYVAKLRVCLAKPHPVRVIPVDPSVTCDQLRSDSEGESSPEDSSPSATPDPPDSEPPTEPALSETPEPETPASEAPLSEAPTEPPPSQDPQPDES